MKLRIDSEKLSIFGYFILVIAIGTLLLSLPGAWTGPGRLSLLDALFTATSAVCVTGLIVVDTALYSGFGQLVILLLIQSGGLGIVTFATLYVAVPRRKVSLVNRGIIKDMYIDEVDSDPRTIVRSIVVSTLVVELAGAVVLYARFRAAGGRAGFGAVFHAVSAFCNAGFSTYSTGLNAFVSDPVVNLVIMLLVVTGGIGFVVLQDIVKVLLGERRRLAYHTRLVLLMTGVLISGAAVFFLVLEWNGAYATLAWPDRVMAAIFQAVTPRTAGFDTVPQANLGLASTALVLALMFTGGSPGSTAGGVKTTTVFVGLLAAFRGHEEDGSIEFRGGMLSSGAVARALSILAKAVVLAFMAVLGMLIAESNTHNFLDILFETVSAFGTVGLSRGITGTLGEAGKAILIGTMFVGRVGLFAMAVSRDDDRLSRFADFPNEPMLLG